MILRERWDELYLYLVFCICACEGGKRGAGSRGVGGIGMLKQTPASEQECRPARVHFHFFGVWTLTAKSAHFSNSKSPFEASMEQYVQSVFKYKPPVYSSFVLGDK